MQLRVGEKGLRHLDALRRQKVQEGHVGIALEQVGKVGFADAHRAGHLVQGQGFCAVLGDVQAGLGHQLHVGLRRVDASGIVRLRGQAQPTDPGEELQEAGVGVHLPEGIVGVVEAVDGPDALQHRLAVRVPGRMAHAVAAGQLGQYAVQRSHHRQQRDGKLYDEKGILRHVVHRVQVAGVHDGDVVFPQRVAGEVDGGRVAIPQAHQHLHIGVPVHGIEVIRIHLAGHVDL